MARRFDDDLLDTIRDRIILRDLIEDHGVQLRRAGHGSWKGLCPFHDEKTPSFTVRDTYGRYHCFGCGEDGDAFGFVMATQGFDFPEAVRFLAGRAGLPVPEPNDTDDDDPSRARRDAARRALTVAQDVFARLLEQSPEAGAARAELTRRGFTLEHARDAGCGYAPVGWAYLRQAFTHHDITEQAAVDAGLLYPDGRGERAAFRGRLTFAIRDRQGRIVGFGARRLSERDPVPGKYKNTAANELNLYRKSDVLYQWSDARAAAVKAGRIFIMEGYTDVMAARAAGVTESVATCGTALTSEHVTMLRRGLPPSTRIVLCFDGDNAGQQATRRAWETTIDIANRCEAVVFPAGTDPCDQWERHGAERVRDLLDDTRPLTQVVLDSITGPARDGSPEQVSQAAQEAADTLALLPDAVLSEQYRAQLHQRFGTSLPAPTARTRHAPRPPQNPHPEPQDTPTPAGWNKHEARLLHRMTIDGPARHALTSAPFPHQLLSEPAQAVWHVLTAAPVDEPSQVTVGKVHDAMDDFPGTFTQLLSVEPLPGSPDEGVRQFADGLVRSDLEAQIQAAIDDTRRGVPGAEQRWSELVEAKEALG